MTRRSEREWCSDDFAGQSQHLNRGFKSQVAVCEQRNIVDVHIGTEPIFELLMFLPVIRQPFCFPQPTNFFYILIEIREGGLNDSNFL